MRNEVLCILWHTLNPLFNSLGHDGVVLLNEMMCGKHLA